MAPSRREFLASTAAGIVGPALTRPRSIGQATDIDRLYDRAVVVDSLAVAVKWDDAEWAAVIQSGYTAIQTTLRGESLEAGMESLAEWHARFRAEPARYLPYLSAQDVEVAKREKRLAVMLGFQNATMIENDVANVDVLHALGTRVIQLTYNSRNLLGDGCTERTDSGLSDFGVAVVHRLNERGIVVDLSHCGSETSRDAIAVSRRPPAFTHTMCRALYEHPRAKSDALLRAIAERGGMIGIAALGYFVGPNPGGATGLARYLDHLDHAVRVAGVEHVGLCSDFEIRGIRAWATKETWYEPRIRLTKPSYQVRWPPWIPELDVPTRFRTVAHGLAKRGYPAGQVEKILGANWVRYFRDVIGG